MPKEEFQRAVECYLTGKETEPWEIINFKLYKSQLPVLERALETAGLMLGADKSRGYCLEMICVDFLSGVSLETHNQEAFLETLARLIGFVPKSQRKLFLDQMEAGFLTNRSRKRPCLRLHPKAYSSYIRAFLSETWPASL